MKQQYRRYPKINLTPVIPNKPIAEKLVVVEKDIKAFSKYIEHVKKGGDKSDVEFNQRIDKLETIETKLVTLKIAYNIAKKGNENFMSKVDLEYWYYTTFRNKYSKKLRKYHK